MITANIMKSMREEFSKLSAAGGPPAYKAPKANPATRAATKKAITIATKPPKIKQPKLKL